MMAMSDSVRPTAATDAAPSLETKKMSATAKTDSITISSTMGIARSRMAWLSGPSFGFPPRPRSASRMRRPTETDGEGAVMRTVRTPAPT